jgi:hypothetical protein
MDPMSRGVLDPRLRGDDDGVRCYFPIIASAGAASSRPSCGGRHPTQPFNFAIEAMSTFKFLDPPPRSIVRAMQDRNRGGN